jgi:hypothetical protein
MSERSRNLLLDEKDKEFIDRIQPDYEAAKAKKPIDKWQKYDKYVEDDQWTAPENEKDEWKPKPQVNICWAAIRTIHANMTSGKTSINITCKRPMYDDITQGLSDVIQSYWDELDMDLKISEGEWIRPKLGSVAIKSTWNPVLKDGRGDIDCEIVHPANVFIDPNITNPWKVQSAEFIDFVKPVSMRYILNKYSKEADSMCKFKKDQLKEILVPETSTADTEIYGDLTDQSSGRIPATVKGTGDTKSFNMRSTVNLHEYWYKDENNKLQVCWYAGMVPLKKSEDDKEIKQNGFYKHGKYPLVYIPYIQKDKRLDGRSELQSLIGQNSKRDGIQDIINILIQDYLVSEKLTGQPQKGYRHGSVKNPEKLTAEAGLLIPTKGMPSQDIHVFEGKTMVENLNVVEGMLTHADRITGQWDITQGRNSPAIKTLGQTSLLMEQAMKPQNDKINTLNTGLRELIELWIDHLSEFVTEEREYMREVTQNVTNPDGTVTTKTVPEPFMFNPSMLMNAPDRITDEAGQLIAKVNETGEPLTRRLYFKINVDIGATLAMTKAYMMEIAFQLWNAKLIDIEGVYKLLPEFPGKGEALERMKAMQQQPQQQGDFTSEEIEQFVQGLPEEILQVLDQMPEEERLQHIMMMMQLPPEQIPGHIEQMLGGVPYAMPTM